jgi:hypothetical protein
METPLMPRIPLGINKQTSLLDGITLLEYYPKERVEALIESDYLKTVWIENRYGVVKNYENEKQQLSSFLKSYDNKEKAFKVQYKKPKHKWGRVLVSNALGCTAFSKKIRNTLIDGLYYDFDLRNAQPEIIRNICFENNIKCPSITEYCNNKDVILEHLQRVYNINKKTVKKLFLRLCFFGTWEGWAKDENITAAAPQFIENFRNELNTIAYQIKNKNEDLFQTARKLKEAKDEKNYIGSMFALYLQEYEERIVQKLTNHLIDNTELMSHPCNKQSKFKVGIYEYDGLKLLIENVDKFGGKDVVMEYLNKMTYELMSFKLQWEEKPVDEGYDISSQLLQLKEKTPQPSSSNLSGVWNDAEAAATIYKLYPHWVFCKDSLYVFDKDTGLWDSDHTSYLKIITQYSEQLRVLDTNSKGEVYQTNKSYGNTLTLMERMPTLIKILCRDDNWLKTRQYSSLKKLLFMNGYYDFQEEKFYDKDTYGFNPDILFMGRIHHDFEPFDMDKIESIKQRLFYDALGKEVGDYLIHNLARGLAGDMMKRILFGLGGTNSGKTILTSAVTLSCGDYVGSFNAENLAYRQSSNDEAQIMRWAMLLRFKRIIFSNEIKSTAELNGNMIKKISSGGDILIGRNHGKCEEEFITHFLPVCFANDLPNIKPYDDAVDGRVRVVSYNKTYVSEPTNELELQADPNIEQELKTTEFQKAFVGLLIQSYTFDKMTIEPIDVLNAKKDWIQDDKNLIDSFKNDFEITNSGDDYVTSKVIEGWINDKKLGITMKKFGMEMKRYASINKKDKIDVIVKKIGGKPTRVWVGLKEIIEEVSDGN